MERNISHMFPSFFEFLLAVGDSSTALLAGDQ